MASLKDNGRTVITGDKRRAAGSLSRMCLNSHGQRKARREGARGG